MAMQESLFETEVGLRFCVFVPSNEDDRAIADAAALLWVTRHINDEQAEGIINRLREKNNLMQQMQLTAEERAERNGESWPRVAADHARAA
jgi:hypothetical protein